MKNRVYGAITVIGLAMLAPGGAFAASPFDGQWNFAVTAKQAPGCGAATYPYVMSVKEGAIIPISGPSRLSTISASVNAAGTVAGMIAARRDRSTFSGRLRKDGSGTGVWSSQDWGCAGTWTARRAAS